MSGNWTYRIDLDPDELQAVGMTQSELEQTFAGTPSRSVDGYHIYLEMPDMDVSSGAKAAEMIVLEEISKQLSGYSPGELTILVSGRRTF